MEPDFGRLRLLGFIEATLVNSADKVSAQTLEPLPSIGEEPPIDPHVEIQAPCELPEEPQEAVKEPQASVEETQETETVGDKPSKRRGRPPKAASCATEAVG